MPDIDLSYAATADDGRDQRAITETGQAGLAASLQERQQRAVTSQYPREQAQLRERLNRLSDALGDHVDPQQVQIFREGQMDQLRERQDGMQQLYEAAQSAVAQLDQWQQPADEQPGHLQQLADDQPGQQRDVSGPYERQQAGLVDLVNRVLSQFSDVQDQQNAYMRQQRQDALAAAASGAGGDLSRVLDRQRADRDAVRDQLSRIRQNLGRSSRDPAALGSASDAIRSARQGPSPQRSADTQRERSGQWAAGEVGQAGLAASLHERQQRHERVAAGQDRREQARLQDRLDQLSERVKGRVNPRQLDALRQGQIDQLRECHDASRQLRVAVRAAAAQLDLQRPRQQLTADGQQGRARDLGERRDRQRAGLNLVSQVLSELSRIQDQQNAYMRRQRQDALAAAASGAGGDLSRVLDRQRADRDAVRDQLSRIRQDLGRSSRDLAAPGDRQQPEPRSAGYYAARQRKQPEAHQARHDAVLRQNNEPSRDQREAQRHVLGKQAAEIIRPETASLMNGITAQTHAAVEGSFTEASQAGAQDAYRTTSNLAKGNFGERMAAAALARDGHQIMYFKPSILGTNQGGIDIYSYKDGLVYLIDNKAFTSHGNISSVSALTTNLAKNIAAAERDLAAMAADVTRSAAERQIIRQALTALEQNQYVKVVTNAALTKNAEIKTGVTQALASQGIRFIDVFKNRGGGS